MSAIIVAQVLNRMDSGGIEAVVMDYYRHIDHEKVQFDFYIANDSLFPQKEELERLGAGIYLIPPYSDFLHYYTTLHKAFREKQYRIVHAHLSTMSLFPLLAAKHAGVPVRICHSHSTASWGEGIKTLLKYVLRPMNKWVANRWFACGEWAGRWMYGNRAFDSGKVYVLPNAIDDEKFAFDPMARATLRAELGIPENCFVVGHVGRFIYQKNHPFLIEVFAELLKSKPGAYLLLVGEGEDEARVRRMIEEKGLQEQVIMTGARRDVNKLYSAMDVFCLPSNYEGYALVAMEAQTAGLACVCSDHVPHEIDMSERVTHLPIRMESIPEWVEQIKRVNPNDMRKKPDSGGRFNIMQAAEQYQAYLLRNYEEAVR